LAESLPAELQASPAPTATVEDAQRIARTIFGLEVEATPLDGEVDRNFRLTDAAGALSVLKLSHAADREAVEVQNAILDHISEGDPSCVIPRVAKARDGSELVSVTDAVGRPCCARLLSYVQGRPLHTMTLEPRQYRRLGAAIASLGRALADFQAPMTDRSIIWDLRAAGRTRALLPHIVAEDDRAQAERALARFEIRRDAFLALRHQVIHHDLNPHNLLATAQTGEMSFGFIDFGDAMFAPLISELAIAAAYHVAVEGDPLDRIREMVVGYVSILPLQQPEQDLFLTLIAARLAQSLAISNWRAANSPLNKSYLLRYSDTNSKALARINEAIERRFCIA
jgi:hydroxylysine kinase